MVSVSKPRKSALKSVNRIRVNKSGLRLNPYVFTGIIGLFLILGGIFYLSNRSSVLSFANIPSEYSGTEPSGSIPVSLELPSLGLKLPVSETVIRDGIWQTSGSELSHLTVSARPGQSGNIIIYGHNTDGVLGRLHKISVTDLVKITNRTGNIFIYKINNIKTVSPQSVEVVSPTEHELLTLYTCTGFLDSQRLVVTALPVTVPRSSDGGVSY